jgi:hypothetical protein
VAPGGGTLFFNAGARCLVRVQTSDATLERRKNYCALGVAFLEDLPMGTAAACLYRVSVLAAPVCFLGHVLFSHFSVCTLSGTLNVIYLVNSIAECVDPNCRWGVGSTCSSISKSCQCDLDSTSALVMLLSALTSASMFAFKVSTLAVIKYSLEVQSMLDEERAALIADLDRALLDPNDPHLSAGQRRKVSVMVSDVLMRHPAPRVSISHPNRPATPEIDRSSDQPHHQVRL